MGGCIDAERGGWVGEKVHSEVVVAVVVGFAEDRMMDIIWYTFGVLGGQRPVNTVKLSHRHPALAPS